MKNGEKRELKRLNRGELLEIILRLKREEETLERQLAEARERLGRRDMVMEKAGSIAEASLALSDVFAAAQRAADAYTGSVRASCSQAEEKNAQAERERQRMLDQARIEADEILSGAREQGARIVEEAERAAREREGSFRRTVEDVLSAHAELKLLLGPGGAGG